MIKESSITLVRKFSAAHFYKNEKWSVEKNLQTFGKCFTEFGHGHDYRLEVEVPAEQEQLLVRALQNLIEKLDHQHLNFVIEEFKMKIPTTENLAVYCQDQIRKLNPKITPIKIKLFETENIWVELESR